MATVQDVISAITIDNYRRSAWANATNYRASLGLLNEKGTIERKDGGDVITWPIFGGNYDAFTVGDYEDNTDKFTPKRFHVQGTLQWGMKRVFDAFSKAQMQKNNGKEALVKWANKRVPQMLTSMISQGGGDSAGKGSLNYELLNRDGGSYTGDGLPFYGLPSIFKFDAATTSDQESDVTSGSTYAGVNLEKDGLSGTIDGVDSYAFTPRGINTDYDWDGTGGSGVDLTADHLPYILDYTQDAVTFGNSPDMQPDCVLFGRTYWSTVRSYFAGKEKIEISKVDEGNNKWGLGTSVHKLYYNGLTLTWDDQMPSTTAYMLNFDQVGLCYLPALGAISGDKYPGNSGKGGAELLGTPADMMDVECQYNDGRNGATISADLLAQFSINPRFQAEIKDRTS